MVRRRRGVRGNLRARAGESRDYFSAWFAASLAESEAGREGVFVTVDRRSGQPIGSTRYLNVR